MKLLIREINCCRECPYCEGYGSYSYDCEYNKGNSKPINDRYEIPEWCPLPEVTPNPEK